MTLKNFLLAVCTCFIFTSAWAIHPDEYKSLNWKKKMEVADKLYEKGFYKEALKIYTVANAEEEETQTALLHRLMRINISLFEFDRALEFAAKVRRSEDKAEFPDTDFWMAMAYKGQADYKRATSIFRNFTKFPFDKKQEEYLQLQKRAKLEMKGIEMAQAMAQDSFFVIDYDLRMLEKEVNKGRIHTAPSVLGDAMVFTIDPNVQVIDVDGKVEVEDYSRVFHAERNEFKRWRNVQKLPGTVNKEDAYVSKTCFTPNGQTMYYTVSARNEESVLEHRIYVTELENGKWFAGRPLGENINAKNSNNEMPNIVVTEDGTELLYFVSDRTGSRGKDIWVAEKISDGVFGTPRNLGKTINTKGDDIYPFYHSNTNTFYYSSNGLPGFGGFDIYRSSSQDGITWMEPENVAFPMNSPYNDVGFVMNENGRRGFVASNRIDTTVENANVLGDNIYEWEYIGLRYALTGLLYEELPEGNNFKGEGVIELLDAVEDTIVATKEMLANQGFFFLLLPDIDYKLVSKRDNFTDFEVDFSTKGFMEKDTLRIDIFHEFNGSDDGGNWSDGGFADDGFVGGGFGPDNSNFSPIKTETKRIGYINYDYNESTYTKAAQDTLKAIAARIKAHPEWNVEIAGHTDDHGDGRSNMKLSEKRAEAALKFLIKQGVDKSRVEVRGYGEKWPIAPNRNADNSDYEEGRRINRRVEFLLKREVVQ